MWTSPNSEVRRQVRTVSTLEGTAPTARGLVSADPQRNAGTAARARASQSASIRSRRSTPRHHTSARPTNCWINWECSFKKKRVKLADRVLRCQCSVPSLPYHVSDPHGATPRSPRPAGTRIRQAAGDAAAGRDERGKPAAETEQAGRGFDTLRAPAACMPASNQHSTRTPWLALYE